MIFLLNGAQERQLDLVIFNWDFPVGLLHLI